MTPSRNAESVGSLPVRDGDGSRRTLNTLTTVKNAKNPFVTSRRPDSGAVVQGDRTPIKKAK